MISVLTNGRLLDCVGGEPREDISIVVEDDKIKDIYSGKKPVPAGATKIDVGRRTILAGLTDAHEHVAFADFPPAAYGIPTIKVALKILENLNLDLQAGFTTVCDKYGANWALKHAVDEGLIKGPRLLISCAMITKTCGHFDFGNFRSGLGEWYAKDTGLVALPRIADGIDDCRKAAREQLRSGADVIKISATGGAGSPNDETTDVGYSEGEITAIVEEANDNGKYVSAHCLNTEGIRRSIKCGVRSIDHGAYFTDETARMLKEKDFFHIPTLHVYEWIVKYGKEIGAPDYFVKKASVMLDINMRSVELTRKYRCNIASGSDCGELRHGIQGAELVLKTECGMTPYEAIKSATMVNAKYFRMEDKIGSIERGKWADIIVVNGHPEEDIKLLGDANNVRLVMKAGQILKNTL